MGRISYLDGHRGIAILMVILFHAFSRWPELMPYGGQYGDVPLFKYGYLGVQLFFLISGFVILMTLEKCDGFKTFVYRRWLRLFPAMLFCSLLIYFTAGFFTERPNGQPVAKDMLAGLSFIEPQIWNKLTGLGLKNLEGAFWSLYVEFKFYIISALFYFVIGSRKLVYALFLCFLSWVTFSFAVELFGIHSLSIFYALTSYLSFNFFGWFAAGAAYYMFVKTGERHFFAIGMLISVFSSAVETQLAIGPLIAALGVSVFFAASILSQPLQRVLSNPVFMFFGFVSYPLYLIHENMMVSITITLGNHLNMIPGLLLPTVGVAFVSILAYIISKHVEPAIKHGLKGSFLWGTNKLKMMAYTFKA